jgi:hypothetical protein
MAAILTRIRHFEELWLTKNLTKIKRENAKMLNLKGVMTKTLIFGSHF